MNYHAVAVSMVLVACAGSHQGQSTCPTQSPTVYGTDSGVTSTPPAAHHRRCRCRATGLDAVDAGVEEGAGESLVDPEMTCIIPLLDRAQVVMDRLSAGTMDVPAVTPADSDAGPVGTAPTPPSQP